MEKITTKAVKRRYLSLRRLRRTRISTDDLVKFYCSAMKPVLEYACQVFHRSLPGCLSDEIERIQRRSLRNAFSGLQN